MSIRPVDMQMVISQTQEVSHIQQQANARASTEQTQFANQLQKEVKHKSEQVVQKDSTGYHEYRYDAKEKGNNEYQQRKNKSKKKSKEEQGNKENSKKSTRERVNFDVNI